MLEQLREAVQKSTAMFDKEKAQERLSKLSGGVAVFKVFNTVWSRLLVKKTKKGKSSRVPRVAYLFMP